MINNISSRFNGRIEKLYLRFNFQLVEKGQRIMDIYSPDILAEQQNLIYLLDNSNNQSEIIKSSEQKLSLLGLTSEQVSQIVRTKKPINPLPVFSPYSGHIHDIGISNGISPTLMSSTMNTNSTEVTKQTEIESLPVSQTSALSIKEGMYVQTGQPVFAVYNISQVWAILNIFQKDAAFVNLGDQVTIASETSPDEPVKANINYIEPVTGLSNSAIKARVYLTNTQNHTFPIGTLVSAEISSREVKGVWVSRTAVVNQGKMQVVFVKVGNHFNATEILSGLETDSLVQVISGLNGNDQIAENGQFMVDSESFIKTIENAK
ncbi:MAG: efflux RND transporter periplasmic adaptor subunit [Bacteroidetes bacterium]|nr:efflux RND transporter periplasmic adaptor subunit [Bacteroidota bacterium]